MSDYPALAGEVVTERHARICLEKGHATHTVDGVDQGTCPRCGSVTVDRVLVTKPTIQELVQQGTVGRGSNPSGPTQSNRPEGQDHECTEQ